MKNKKFTVTGRVLKENFDVQNVLLSTPDSREVVRAFKDQVRNNYVPADFASLELRLSHLSKGATVDSPDLITELASKISGDPAWLIYTDDGKGHFISGIKEAAGFVCEKLPFEKLCKVDCIEIIE